MTLFAEINVEAVEDQDGFAGDWTLEVAAICADPPAGYAVVHTRSAIDSADKVLSAPGSPVVVTATKMFTARPLRRDDGRLDGRRSVRVRRPDRA